MQWQRGHVEHSMVFLMLPLIAGVAIVVTALHPYIGPTCAGGGCIHYLFNFANYGSRGPWWWTAIAMVLVLSVAYTGHRFGLWLERLMYPRGPYWYLPSATSGSLRPVDIECSSENEDA